MRYDKELILSEVNMLDVLAKLNIPVSDNTARTDLSNGNKREILCPFHDDKNFGSASIFVDSKRHFKGIHCFACGESWNVIKLVQQKLGLNYGQTLEWLAELCPGGKNNYIIEDKFQKGSSWGVVSIDVDGIINNTSRKKAVIVEKKNNPITGLLTNEDLRFIGITDYPKYASDKNGAIIGCCMSEPEVWELPDECYAEKDYIYSTDKNALNPKYDETLDAIWYIKSNSQKARYSYNDMVEDNPEGAVNMLCLKITILLKEKQSIVNVLSGSPNKTLVNVVHLTKKEIKRLKNLYNKIMNAWNASEKIEYI